MRASRLELTLLGFIIAAGAYLRFHDLGGPSMWLDEILSFGVASGATRQPLWHWLLSTFEPEHGPLFHASLLAGRFLQRPETSVRLLAAICGTITIPLVWIAGRRFNAAAGIAAAILIAFAPLNVYYSREGRPYAIVMMLTAATIAAFALRARWQVFAIIAVAFAYASSIAAPALVAIAISAAVALIFDRGVAIRALICAAAGIAVTALLYRNHSPGFAVAATPDVEFGRILQSFSIAALQPSDAWRIAYVVFALAIGGAIVLVIRDRATGAFFVGMAVLPAAIAWLVLWWLKHTFEMRYLAAALPAYLVLAAAGIAAIVQRIRWSEAVAAIIAAALMVKGLPAALHEPYRKLDWRLIASTLWQHAHPGDVVIAANDWTSISLGFYLNRLPSRVHLFNAAESTRAIDHFTQSPQPVWIVSSGIYRTRVLPGWLCRYPLLMASDLEEFGLHFSPSVADFMTQRSTEVEQRTLAASFAQRPFSLTFAASDGPLLSWGWAGVERIGGDDVRWVVGNDASIIAPVDTTVPHTMHVRMTPFAGPKLPPQTVRVFADDIELRSVTMTPGWQTYDFAIPPQSWRATGPHTIRFKFSRANVPALLDPASNDKRALSAMFTDLAFDGVARTGPALFTMRLQEDGGYLGAAQWRGFRSKFAPSRWNRDALAGFAARSGFDPVTAVPRLLDGTLSIEQIVSSMLDRSGCLDNVSFARNAYWSIIGRSITEEDAVRMVKPWKSERDRRRLVGGLVESSEFRERMSAQASRTE